MILRLALLAWTAAATTPARAADPATRPADEETRPVGETTPDPAATTEGDGAREPGDKPAAEAPAGDASPESAEPLQPRRARPAGPVPGDDVPRYHEPRGYPSARRSRLYLRRDHCDADGPRGRSPARTRVVAGMPMTIARSFSGPPHSAHAQPSTPKQRFRRSHHDAPLMRTRGVRVSRRLGSSSTSGPGTISFRQSAFGANTPW